MTEEQEHRGWYESWLDAIAGRRVATGPIFIVWVGASAVVAGAACS